MWVLKRKSSQCLHRHQHHTFAWEPRFCYQFLKRLRFERDPDQIHHYLETQVAFCQCREDPFSLSADLSRTRLLWVWPCRADNVEASVSGFKRGAFVNFPRPLLGSKENVVKTLNRTQWSICDRSIEMLVQPNVCFWRNMGLLMKWLPKWW